MRWGRITAGVVLFLTGAVWLLQGIRVLPASFMTGSSFWAATGAVLAIAGIAVLAGAGRRRTP